MNAAKSIGHQTTRLIERVYVSFRRETATGVYQAAPYTTILLFAGASFSSFAAEIYDQVQSVLGIKGFSNRRRSIRYIYIYYIEPRRRKKSGTKRNHSITGRTTLLPPRLFIWDRIVCKSRSTDQRHRDAPSTIHSTLQETRSKFYYVLISLLVQRCHLSSLVTWHRRDSEDEALYIRHQIELAAMQQSCGYVKDSLRYIHIK